MLCVLIMAGGKGTRFWPLSTEEKPKQFLNLVGERTMIQMTVDRILPIIPIERVFVCTCEKYIDLVKEQLPNLPKRNIVIEPEGRNTAPCIALSAMVIERYYKDTTMLVLPADHLIKSEEEFRNIIIKGAEFLNRNNEVIITLGMMPNRAEIGYGYINYGEEVEVGIKAVKKFVEKPNLDLAKKYLKEGDYLWNGGIFLWKTFHILNEIKKYTPNIYETLNNTNNVSEEELQNYISSNYVKLESISIDYAVLEKSKNIFVVPSEIGWDDIGTWKSIERYREKDSNNNILARGAKAIESESNIVLKSDKRVVVLGVKDILAIETEDTMYIINKKYMDKLKEYKGLID